MVVVICSGKDDLVSYTPGPWQSFLGEATEMCLLPWPEGVRASHGWWSGFLRLLASLDSFKPQLMHLG